ncbi:gamma-glutamyltransferase [Streptomyces drozdowiczii]|uniref:Gamma-glutamyltransferase n=1 Tax=Streptomyces drozdowiczii TaxID=202862 RepID=A0ABY6PP14_9ACTN|nr:gamma-glutamyltransferase [Streptomyces drozdowiczii]MCX0246571.1 gamma-glutamyltransferase [Streptomyces drozdowiczii]UZK53947.1 gamma-glutamyltransferase [Streptomyces drozdowiczii]
MAEWDLVPSKKQHDQQPLLHPDAIDIPVLFRDGPGGRTRGEWRRKDHAEWTGPAFPASNGWYLPTTTWREILKAAINVGRDLSPWLDRPYYAAREIGARIAPLDAYLDLHDGPRLHDYNAGRRLTANVVLEQGTEASARGALGYRLGMTMAEWACRSLLGLGQTYHIEDSWPLDIEDPAANTKSVKGQKNPRPDLHGWHNGEYLPWLIEAKGGEGGPEGLQRGWEQLEGGCTVVHPHGLDHRLLLCGAALKREVSSRNDLFVTIRHELHIGGSAASAGTCPGSVPGPGDGPQTAEASLEEDDQGSTLLDVARSQMLLFLSLRAVEIASSASLRLVPVARDRHNRRASGLLTLMEDDHSTRERREALARQKESPSDGSARGLGLESFLTARIPNSEVILGMSQRLYAACEELYQADREIADQTPGLRAEDRVTVGLSDEAIDDRASSARREYRERQQFEQPRIQRRVRDAFTAAEEQRPWASRLGANPEFTLSPGTLEGTTPETYLAINPETVFHRHR